MKITTALACALLAMAASRAHAESELSERVRLFIDGQALPGGEVEVAVGDPDPRLQLAPCGRYEPFIPAGARLWGRTSLGVRCVQGSHWTVFLPVHVRVFAPALVAARPIGRGQALTAEDVRFDRVELTAFTPGALFASAPDALPDQLLEGRIATRAIAAGEPLRREHLRAAPVVQAGDAVSVHAGGRGFQIVTEGKALAAGVDGQTIQVAVAGKVLTGTARPGKVIEVR